MGKEFPVRKETTIGRQDADVTIQDEEVSRRHAIVRPVDGALEIEDLGSLNGTHVNGTKVTSVARLAPGDVIQVGQCQLEVVQGAT